MLGERILEISEHATKYCHNSRVITQVLTIRNPKKMNTIVSFSLTFTTNSKPQELSLRSLQSYQPC